MPYDCDMNGYWSRRAASERAGWTGRLRVAPLAACLAACLAAGGLAIAGAPARADPGPASVLLRPWPSPPAGHAGTAVTFPSHSPFTLVDVGQGDERDPPTEGRGILFLPEDASATTPAPAVVMVHGAGGVQNARELTYGRQLAEMGIASLVVDAFAARRDRASSFVERLLEITETMMLADAYAGLRFLDQLPEVDAGRAVLVGFSYGGMVSVFAAYAQVAEALAPDGPRFVGHVAFYGPCVARFTDSRTTGAPVLMLYGENDAIVDPPRCAEIADDLAAGGSEVEIIAYPEAYHQWDGASPTPRRIGRNIAGCRLEVGQDGVVRDRRTWLSMTHRLTRQIILGLCVDSEGYLIGRDDEVRARSNAALGRFLHEVQASRQ